VSCVGNVLAHDVCRYPGGSDMRAAFLNCAYSTFATIGATDLGDASNNATP